MAEGVQEGKTLKELEREITCSVCQEHYTEPKVLPCLHYYCKKCVRALALKTTSNKPFSCPKCHKEITLPQGGVEGLKTAFFINHMKSNFSALEKVHGKIEVRCEGCTSSYKAEAFCRHCTTFICPNCEISHRKMKVFSSHEVVSLEDLKQGRAKQIPVAKPATEKCSIHEEPLLIYCFDCNSFICRDCTVTEHREHNFEFSKVVSSIAKKNLLEEITPFKNVAAELSSAVDNIRTTKEVVETQRKSLIQDIKIYFDELYSILEERKKELVQETSKRVEEKIEKLSVQEMKLSLTHGEVQNIIDFTKKFVGHSSDNEIMSLHADIKRHMQRNMEDQSKPGKILEPEEEADMVVEVKCKKALQELLQNMAEVTQMGTDPRKCTVRGEGMTTLKICQTAEVYLTTRLSNGRIARGNTAVVSELKSLYNGSVIKCRVDQSGPGEYRIQYRPTVRGRHELSVSVDGQQVAGSPFPVFVSISPAQLGIMPVNMWRSLIRPRSIITTAENNILVAVEKTGIFKLNKNGGKSILVEYLRSNLNELEAITTDKEGNIYCTDFTSNKIMKCNKNGDNVQVYEVKLVTGLGRKGVAVVGDEVMLCERSNTGTIMIYNKELEYVRRIQHEGGEEFEGLSVDINGNIYVTDCKDSVHVYNTNGIFLHSFCSQAEGITTLNGPVSLCVSGQYAYVVNIGGNFVSVFTTAGDYVTMFGHVEGEAGFRNPLSVCVDKDGFVYVIEFWNNRIRCF